MNDENIFEGIFDDLYQSSPEDEHHFWDGEGFITFYVVQNIIKDDIFEIEVEDYDGCAGGATKNSERCIGCLHHFGTPDSDWVNKHRPQEPLKPAKYYSLD